MDKSSTQITLDVTDSSKKNHEHRVRWPGSRCFPIYYNREILGLDGEDMMDDQGVERDPSTFPWKQAFLGNGSTHWGPGLTSIPISPLPFFEGRSGSWFLWHSPRLPIEG